MLQAVFDRCKCKDDNLRKPGSSPFRLGFEPTSLGGALESLLNILNPNSFEMVAMTSAEQEIDLAVGYLDLGIMKSPLNETPLGKRQLINFYLVGKEELLASFGLANRSAWFQDLSWPAIGVRSITSDWSGCSAINDVPQIKTTRADTAIN